MGEKLTKPTLRALEWIAAREPVGLFDASGPSLHFVRKLEGNGLLQRVKAPGRFVCYALTDIARTALAPQPPDK